MVQFAEPTKDLAGTGRALHHIPVLAATVLGKPGRERA